MKMKLTALMVVAGLVLVAVVAWRPAVAQGQVSKGGVKWQYGRLVLGAGDPVFITGGRESKVLPPSGSPGNGSSNDGQAGNRVTFVWKDVYNTEMMTLDALGAEGWEAFSTVGDGRTTSIFLKRQI